MIADLKYFDGSLSKIDRAPQDLRDIYATAFEVSPTWLVEAASRRQKWIDQAQSLNIYMAGASGKKLDETYKLAWLRGLKTTYYLRTIAASHMEKSTTRTGALNAVSANVPDAPAAVTAEVTEGAACYLRPGDPGFEECEACQ
jgi:ribonucleoside-diphosphate reductase alpha chain